VQIDSANANCNTNTTAKDFAFYLAIHAESEPIGGNVVAPDPSVDSSTAESNRIVNAIKGVYFNDTGISNTISPTVDETFYYMWNVLTAKTPCGIIECGALQDAHDSVILADHQRVASGIAHGLCDAFGIAWKGYPITPPPVVVPPPIVTPPVLSVTTSTNSAGPVTVVITPDYKKGFNDIKIIASKFHWFYQGDFKSILNIISKYI
jgi:hypothetical protein